MVRVFTGLLSLFIYTEIVIRILLPQLIFEKNLSWYREDALRWNRWRRARVHYPPS